MPSVLPWALLLALLALKFNRTFEAWFALVPVLLFLGVQTAANSLGMSEESEWDLIFRTARTMSFALAAMWLLLPWLMAGHRFVAFLKAVPVLWVFAGLTAFAEQGLYGEIEQVVFLGILTGMLGVVMPMTLMLAGWRCKGHFSVWRFLTWTLLWSFGLAILVLTPLALISAFISEGPNFWEFLGVLGVCVGFVCGVLLPFLLLSIWSQFHENRFQTWLLGAETGVPPIVAPSVLAAADVNPL